MSSNAGLLHIAVRQVGKRCGFPAQAQALGRLKKISSSRLRKASGASPRAQQSGVGAVQPDHFAAALEKLQGAQGAAWGMAGHLGSRGAAGPTAGDARCTAAAAAVWAAGEGSQESPGQQRHARWDPMADTEDRLALQRLSQRAAALSGHPSPGKVR